MISKPGQDLPHGLTRNQLLVVALAIIIFSVACSSALPISLAQKRPPTPAAPLGLIAYVGNDGNIYTVGRDGKGQSTLTKDANLSPGSGETGRIYQFPTWAPDGQRLAFIRITTALTGPEASLFSALSDGNQQAQVFTSQDTLPFYLFWSPNSQAITFLGSTAAGEQAQYLVPAAGGESKFISNGQPYFWDWAPDNLSLIVHIGGANSDNPDARITLMGLDGSIQKTELDLKPGIFQAPAWSPADDLLALVVQTDAGEQELILAGRDGKIKTVLAPLSGPVAMAWSPKDSHLAYTTLVQTDSGPAFRLVELDSAHPETSKQVVQGDVFAFFWSPDGQKITYFILGSGQSGAADQLVAQGTPSTNLGVQVYDLASGKTQKVAAFTPTTSFQQILPYYDQYQRSGTIWSPDSQNLVLSGEDSNGENVIYVVDVAGGPLHKIAEGNLAFWSWK